jgi:Flp pilus assembly CpaF family ATPase
MFEVIFAICFTVQNMSEPLLILPERSIMAHIAIILSENNLSDIIIEEIVGHLGKNIDQKEAISNAHNF